MPGWKGSARRSELPADWSKIRKRIIRRDQGMCQWDLGHGQKCLRTDEPEVDHIKRGSDHSDSNLRTLCHWHHLRKSGSEGNEVTAAQRRVIKTKFRRSEQHPGVL